jgi:hypothetical protein
LAALNLAALNVAALNVAAQAAKVMSSDAPSAKLASVLSVSTRLRNASPARKAPPHGKP